MWGSALASSGTATATSASRSAAACVVDRAEPQRRRRAARCRAARRRGGGRPGGRSSPVAAPSAARGSDRRRAAWRRRARRAARSPRRPSSGRGTRTGPASRRLRSGRCVPCGDDHLEDRARCQRKARRWSPRTATARRRPRWRRRPARRSPRPRRRPCTRRRPDRASPRCARTRWSGPRWSWQQVVDERRGERVAVARPSENSSSSAPPMPCTVPPAICPSTTVRVDHRSAVLGDDVPQQRDLTGVDVDLAGAHVGGVGPDGERLGSIARRRLEPHRDVRRQRLVAEVGDVGDLGERQSDEPAFRGPTLDRRRGRCRRATPRARGRRCGRSVRRRIAGRVADRAGDHRAAAAPAGPGAERRDRRVALDRVRPGRCRRPSASAVSCTAVVSRLLPAEPPAR